MTLRWIRSYQLAIAPERFGRFGSAEIPVSWTLMRLVFDFHLRMHPEDGGDSPIAGWQDSLELVTLFYEGADAPPQLDPRTAHTEGDVLHTVRWPHTQLHEIFTNGAGFALPTEGLHVDVAGRRNATMAPGAVWWVWQAVIDDPTVSTNFPLYSPRCWYSMLVEDHDLPADQASGMITGK